MLRARLQMSSCPSWWALAFVLDDQVIHVSRGWAQKCQAEGRREEMEAVLRHELVHLLCHRHPEIRRRFRLKEHSWPKLWFNHARHWLRLIPYSRVSPEESLAERVAALDRRTLRALRALRRCLRP